MARRLPHLDFRTFLLVLLWVAVNAVVFWNTYKMYKGKPEHYYLRSILGRGLCISRGTGSVLNVSCCLILLPVCKWSSTVARRLFARLSRATLATFIDAAKNMHIACGVTVFAASVVHTGAHVVNAINFSRHYHTVWTEINMAAFPGQDPATMVLTTLPGITGLLMVLLIAAMFVTSLRCFRSRYYNFFYYAHFGYFPFLVLLFIHPMSGALKEQVNWKEHVPGCVWNTSRSRNHSSDTTYCQTEPVFTSMETQTWIWVLVPLVFYSVDLLVRIFIRSQSATILESKLHPGNIMELRIRKKIQCQPGQYILLQCPSISNLEWHPFSLTSCPDMTHDYWSVHLNTRGDWCAKLRHLLAASGSRNQVRLHVDGPYGSPMCDILHSRLAVCIAGGIGITPYISAFQHLIRNGWTSKPERIHLIWVVRNQDSVQWAAPILAQLLEDAWCSPNPDKLELRIHTTTGTSEGILEKTYPSLAGRIFKGRPGWKECFSLWRDFYQGHYVNVFSCGPRSFNQKIRRQCHNFSVRGSTHFRFKQEAF